MKKAEAPASKWCTPEGSLIACTEKNKVMAENLEEIKTAIEQLEGHGQYYLPEKDLSALDTLIDFIRTIIDEV